VKKTLPVAVMVAGLALLYPLQRWIDAGSPREVVSEESLYFSSGEKIKQASLGLHGLVADIYWIRTVQYFGRKLIDSNQPLGAAASSNLRMDLLAPLLDIIVTLDPHHLAAYRFGAIFLPERDPSAAVELLERGIRDNPDEWRLYQDLAYIYWQAGDYEKAAAWYERGGQVAGSPWWMRDLAGLMKIKGGSREVARAIYSEYSRSDDPKISAQAVERLKQLRSLDERDVLNNVLARYKEQTGSCPASLRVLAQRLHSMGFNLSEGLLPVDPDGFPYALDGASCKATLSRESTIMRE
jgi:tetratricopeptide (TPR) repeat protein